MGQPIRDFNDLEKLCCFYYFSLFLGLITSCCSGKWALTHSPPPPLKELFGEDQRLDLKDGRNWAQYGHSYDDYLIGWWCSIVGLVSFILPYQFKGDVKGPLLFERKGNRLARVVYLLWGEGLLQGCSMLHPVVVVTLLWIGESFKVTVLHGCVGACTFAHRNPILEYCSLWHCSFHSW